MKVPMSHLGMPTRTTEKEGIPVTRTGNAKTRMRVLWIPPKRSLKRTFRVSAHMHTYSYLLQHRKSVGMEAEEKYILEAMMRAIIQLAAEALLVQATTTVTAVTLTGTPTKDKVAINSKGSDKVVPCSRNSSGRRISSKRASSRTSSDSRGLEVCSNSHSLRSLMAWASSNSSNSPSTCCKTKTNSTLQSKGRGSSLTPLSKSSPQKSYASFS